MTLRSRIALIAAAAVAVAVVAASVGLYAATATALVGTVDRSLAEVATEVTTSGRVDRSFAGGPRVGPYGGAGGTLQVVVASGEVLAPGPRLSGTDPPLPVDDTTLAVARGEHDVFLRTVTIDDTRLRILAVPAGRGLALQVARPLTEVDAVLDDLRRHLVLASLLGVALAAALGMVVARRAVRPVDALTRVAEDVAATRDLSRRIGPGGSDEVGRLARAFDRMLEQLEQARNAQQQLIADASHELRTPLTSLRTNIEVLARLEDDDGPGLDPGERRRLVDDVIVQLDEFTHLIGGLVELARGARPAQAVTEVRLDELAREVVARSRGNGPRIVVDAQPAVVEGEPDRLERCLANLLDNARKYAPDGPIDVTVRPGVVHVRDRGAGIDPADLPHLFDRFYRATGARGQPGSGLGLAIVRQVVESHGGEVEAANAPDGGAVFTLRLPAVDDSEPPDT